MKVEEETTSDVQDVSMTDVASATSSVANAAQSLPINRFDLEVCSS